MNFIKVSSLLLDLLDSLIRYRIEGLKIQYRTYASLQGLILCCVGKIYIPLFSFFRKSVVNIAILEQGLVACVLPIVKCTNETLGSVFT